MNSLVIESANFWWLIMAAIATWRVAVWRANNHLSAQISVIVCAWVWLFAASALNHGWFAISRHLSPEDERWHTGMMEWRWLAVLVTAAMFAWGMTRFMALIEGWDIRAQLAMFSGSFLIAFVVGFY